MTAIDDLVRLESPALWRPEAGAQRREVYVAIGEAELVVQDRAGTALSHWSLPALERLNPNAMPARYAPAVGAGEELEIEEPDMVAALDRVMSAVERGRRRPGALRRIATGLIAGVALGVAIMWLPGALRDHARKIMPAAQRTEIGQRILDELDAVAGPPCTSLTGTEALETLRGRVLPTVPGRLVVLRDLAPPALALPGGLIALSDRVLVTQDDPDVAAGHVLSAALAARARAPVADFIDRIGLVALVRLLASSDLRDGVVTAYVERLLTAPPPRLPETELRAGFDAARLAWGPWARSIGLSADDASPSDMTSALDDPAWQALREICSR